jgi:hypothetical protein
MGFDGGLSLCAKYCEKYFFVHKNGLTNLEKIPGKKYLAKIKSRNE